MRRFKCKRDDLTIRGRIFGDTSVKRTVVILSHCFLANQKSCRAYAEMLAKQGFICLTFDFCGGGLGVKSDGKTEDMTVLTEVLDLKAIIACVKRKSFTDRIVLMGCSQGGFVSAMVARRLKDDIAGLILLFPAFCIPDDARKGQMMAYHFDPEHIPDLLGKFPMKLGGDYAKTVLNMNIHEEIKGYEGPVLYLHGTEDKIVDIAYAREAHTYYEDCVYHEIDGGGHGFRGKYDQEARRYLMDFVASHFGDNSV